MIETIGARWPLQPQGRGPGSTACRWVYRDGGGSLAVVASITAPFCGDCNRLRVTADGVAYTCLFAAPGSGLDLRPWLTPETGKADLRKALAGLWRQRSDRWSEERLELWNAAEPAASDPAVGPRHAEMAYLGG